MILFLVCILITHSFSQTASVDSLIQVLRSAVSDSAKEEAIMALSVSRANPDFIFKFAKAIIAEGQRQQNQSFISLGYSQLAYGYTRSDNQDKALKAALEAYKLAESCSDYVKVIALNNVAVSNTYNLKKQKEYLEQAINIINSTKEQKYFIQ